MKIAVFGWYGHNNAGDERIKYCLYNFIIKLGGIACIDFYDLHDNAIKGKTARFDDYDLVIIGGGGLILSNHNYHDFIFGINTTIITIGVSVETELLGNPKKFALSLLKKSKVFLVRDQGSYEKLCKFDVDKKVKISSDLTFLLPYEPLHIKNKDKIGINLFAKPKNNLILRKAPSTFRLLNKIGFKNYPRVLCFSKIMKKLNSSFELLPIPLYCVPQSQNFPEYQMNDINFMKKYFQNVPNYFKDQEIDMCQLFISMRLHGLIFSVQKGIIPLTFNTYPKQINFMKDIGLEKAIISVNKMDEIDEKIEYIINNQSQYNEKILSLNKKYSEIIQKDMINSLNVVQ
jgi:polysaccharide pyruvyl transferase WcaK-like protein